MCLGWHATGKCSLMLCVYVSCVDGVMCNVRAFVRVCSLARLLGCSLCASFVVDGHG